jgi:TIR domain
MSEGPREYDLHFEATEELEKQAQKAEPALRHLAVQLAASELDGRSSEVIVFAEHVRKAAEILFQIPPVAAPAKPIFISCSRGDGPFIDELKAKLERHHLAYFESGRIKTGAQWTKAISKAIQGCTVFLSVVTPRFLESNWFLIEGGAALCANKRMYFALRHVEEGNIPSPFNQFQVIRIDTERQINALIAELRRIVRPKRQK